jgi:hypothetical protein
MKEIDKYKLTSNVTVGQLLSWMAEKSDHSKSEIVKLIRHRFENRYLKHIDSVDSGFLIIAVSCFVIETLQSFREGEPDTSRIGKRMFNNFFNDNQDNFSGFHEISDEFYKDIRCGILHQSETTNAWRILKNGKLIDKTEYSINADLFLKSLYKSINKYIDDLTHSDFNSKIWKNAIIKLTDICENCKRK